MYLWVLAECYLLQIKSKKSKDSDTAFVLLSVPTFLSLVHSDKLCRILIANIPILDPYNFGHWNCRLSLLSPKRCCCWVYIHHHIPVQSNNIVKEKGILIPRKYTIQCPRLSEPSPPLINLLKICLLKPLFSLGVFFFFTETKGKIGLHKLTKLQ